MYKLENGQSVSKYCKENNISYFCIWKRILSKNMTPDQAVEDFLSKKDNPRAYHWFYEGTTLSQYCKNNNLPYQRIINKYHLQFKKRNRKPMTMEEVIEMFKKGENNVLYKHFYHGQPLKTACKQFGINYTQVVNKYHKWKLKRPCTIEEVVDYFRVDDPVESVRNY